MTESSHVAKSISMNVNRAAEVPGSASGDTVAPTNITRQDVDHVTYNMLGRSQREALKHESNRWNHR